MTRQAILAEMTRQLNDAGIESAAYDSRVLLEWVLKIDRSEFYMNPQKELTDLEEESLKKVCAMRSAHKPLQYIMHQAEFMGYSFYVDEHVLIPRFDTECLVEYVTERIGDQSSSVLDLCCGSGCIGISIQKICKHAKVTLSDLSQEALEVSKRNAKNLEADVTVTYSDLFEKLPKHSFDEIVSNPPYIPTQVIEGLMPEVRDHEPMMALDGSKDGLYFYRKIIAHAKDYLRENGWLSFEIGAEQGPAVRQLMEEAGFCQVIVKKDLAGLDRIVSGMKG